MRLTRRAALGTALGASLPSLSGCVGSLATEAPPCPATVPSDATTRIGFAGDVMLGRSVDARWRDAADSAAADSAGAGSAGVASDGADSAASPDDDAAGPAGVWGSLHARLSGLDGLFVNLECCVSDRGERRPGRTYHFRADPDWAVPALRAAGVTWASLANNHVLDFGRQAFADTFTHLRDGGIAHGGAGDSLDAAVEPSIVTVGDLTVAAVGLTDRSPSYGAARDEPGTAFVRMDPRVPRTRRIVDAALARARDADPGPDLVVASLHWGPNWEPRPSETQRRFARWLVDRGVDVVHGHSAHVVQGVETYRGRPIVYDAGDLVDDYVVKDQLRNDRSILFELVVADGRLDALRLHPVLIADGTVHAAPADEAAWLRDRLRTLSEPLGSTVERDGSGDDDTGDDDTGDDGNGDDGNGDGLRIPLAASCEQ